MELMVVGLNHNTAPVELREQVAFDERSAGTALNSLLEAGQLGEATILSTCNRTECYCVGETAPAEEVVTWLAQHHGLTAADLSNSIYVFQGTAAVEHAMRVAAGLDSLVVGETQILGQMKGAFAAAVPAQTFAGNLQSSQASSHQHRHRACTGFDRLGCRAAGRSAFRRTQYMHGTVDRCRGYYCPGCPISENRRHPGHGDLQPHAVPSPDAS